MEEGPRSKNPKVHITESASDTVFNNCEFIGVDLQNDGKRTKILKTKFSALADVFANSWHTTWWGILILTIFGGLSVGLILFFIFGIGKNAPEIGTQIINISLTKGELNEFSKGAEPVVLSPKMIELSPKLGSIHEIKISNPGSKPIYQVQLKITVEKGDFNLSNIELLPTKVPSLSQSLTNSEESLRVGLDYLYLSGKDSNGTPMSLVFVRALDPHETMSLQWKIPPGYISKDSRIELKIIDFSNEPAKILTKNGAVMSSFAPKETIIISTMGQMVKSRNSGE